MSPILEIKNISLSHIDFNDFSCSISPDQDVVPGETLRKSITNHGILHPPLVREINTDFYSIVAGRKRLLAVHSLHAESTCTCLVISRQVPEVDVFSILLAEIQLTRQLTPVEKAIFLQKITAITAARPIIREFLLRLDLAPHSFALNQALKLLDLAGPILRSIHHGQIHETVAHDFVLLSPGDRLVLFEIMTSLRLSFSNQKKLLNICRELASRSSMSIAALLDNEEVHGILQHQDANPPQKTKNLMLWLSRKHMPQSTQAEAEFSRFMTAMQLPQNVSVSHTPYFEDDSITLSITFRNRKSFQFAWEKIRHATHSSEN